MLFRFLRCFALTCAVSACSAIKFSSQEMRATFDPKTDVLELELVYHDVEVGSDTSPASKSDHEQKIVVTERRQDAKLRNATEMLSQIATGRRRFMLGITLLDFDLDYVAVQEDTAWDELDTSTEADEVEAEFIARATAFSAGVSMREARVYLDEQQHLTIYQRLRIQNISVWTRLLYDYLAEVFRREAGEWPVADEVDGKLYLTDDLVLDDATIALIRADALAQYQWISWTQSGLRLSLPVSPALMAQVIKRGIHGIGELAETRTKQRRTSERGYRVFEDFTENTWRLSKLLGPLSELTMHDNHLIFVFAPDADGSIQFHFPNDGPEKSSSARKDDGELLEHLEQEGWELPLSWAASE